MRGAVRDNETGLVWERSPDVDTKGEWIEALRYCTALAVGGRKGWHVPMLEQLLSLFDPNGTATGAAGNVIRFPEGNPFKKIDDEVFWTATISPPSKPDEEGELLVWAVGLESGNPIGEERLSTDETWCVRGGQAFDGQDVLGLYLLQE